ARYGGAEPRMGSGFRSSPGGHLMINPYQGLPNHQFWRRAVSGVEHHLLDPVVAPKFKIEREERVATAGSCFAQHISRRLSQIGFNYFVTEAGEGLSEAERRDRNYG